MGAFTTLALLCLAMLSGSFLAGNAPLIMRLSPRKLRLISTFGAGLLIGTALIVILPEGVDALYGVQRALLAHRAAPSPSAANAASAAAAGAAHRHRRQALDKREHPAFVDSRDPASVATPGDAGTPWVLAKAAAAAVPATTAAAADRRLYAKHVAPLIHRTASADAAEVDDDVHDDDDDDADDAHAGHDHPHTDHDAVFNVKRYIGTTLILGFVMMFLIDSLGGGHAHDPGQDAPPARAEPRHAYAYAPAAAFDPATGGARPSAAPAAAPDGAAAHRHARGMAISTSATSLAAPSAESVHDTTRDPATAAAAAAAASPPRHGVRAFAAKPAAAATPATTIGLVIHSAADGIALGAASSVHAAAGGTASASAASAAAGPSLQMVVFVALLLHKAPAALGLASVLLGEGRARAQVRRHVLYFSLAAPVAALATYGVLWLSAPAAGGVPDPLRHLTVQRWTGVALLFSAGTFLYVAAVHILGEISQPLPEEADDPADDTADTDTDTDTGGGADPGGPLGDGDDAPGYGGAASPESAAARLLRGRRLNALAYEAAPEMTASFASRPGGAAAPARGAAAAEMASVAVAPSGMGSPLLRPSGSLTASVASGGVGRRTSPEIDAIDAADAGAGDAADASGAPGAKSLDGYALGLGPGLGLSDGTPASAPVDAAAPLSRSLDSHRYAAHAHGYAPHGYASHGAARRRGAAPYDAYDAADPSLGAGRGALVPRPLPSASAPPPYPPGHGRGAGPHPAHGPRHRHGRLSRRQIAVMLVGMLVPLLLSLGKHPHPH